jgi:hypothetical protein
MKSGEILRISLNSIILALIYTFIGATMSFVLYYLFDEFNDEWKKRSLFFKLADVTIEISILALSCFWSSYFIGNSSTVFKVSARSESMIDNYTSTLFFLFAVFVFLDGLTYKLQYIHNENLAPLFNKIFPKYGSIIDLSLSYSK